MQAQLAIQRHVDGPALSKVTRFGPMSKRRDMQEPQEIGCGRGPVCHIVFSRKPANETPFQGLTPRLGPVMGRIHTLRFRIQHSRVCMPHR